MNLFGLSPGELLLIMMVAMVVLGPEKLPEVAASLGKWIREFRRATEELTAQFAGDNPLYEIQRALSLTDDPVPAAPTPEQPIVAEPVYTPPDVQPAVAAPEAAARLSAPVRSDYFNFPQLYPSMSDLWVHGSLPDVTHRNGHAPLEIPPLSDEWTFGVPVVRCVPAADAGRVAGEEVASSPAAEAPIETNDPWTEPMAEAETEASSADVPTIEEMPATEDGASVMAADDVPDSHDVAELGMASFNNRRGIENSGGFESGVGKATENGAGNGAVGHRSDETRAIPVPAGAGEQREGDQP